MKKYYFTKHFKRRLSNTVEYVTNVATSIFAFILTILTLLLITGLIGLVTQSIALAFGVWLFPIDALTLGIWEVSTLLILTATCIVIYSA